MPAGSAPSAPSVRLAVAPETVVYAVRYCLGRQSYAAADGAELVAEYAQALPENLRAVLIRDLVSHIEIRSVVLDEPKDITRRWEIALTHLRAAEGGRV